MPCSKRIFLPLGLASTMLLMSGAASAADRPVSDTDQKLRVLQERIDKLETQNRQIEKSMDAPYISDEEPQITARLKALESQANSYRTPVSIASALEGITAEASITMMAQDLSGASGGGAKDGELNYRADAAVTVPGGSLGNAEGFLFTQFRMGQGLGLENPDGAFNSFNASSFQRPGSEASDSTVLLAQAWYQLDIPLPLSGNPGLSRKRLEMTIGKIDPFVFFDQNAIADDETRGFMNQSFVHNPLLDAGGDVGVDDFGYTPGLRLAYLNEHYAPSSYGVSLGVFGSGQGASYDDSLQSPFVILQAETTQRFLGGLAGNYRIYVWRNGRGENFDGTEASHSGVGISMDQQIGDYLTAFARIGKQTSGDVSFDQTLTLGTEIGGSYWQRGADAMGVALGWLQISDEFKAQSATLDSDADGNPDYGYQAKGSEQVAELYYRYRLNSQFEISPNLQSIRNAGGNPDADTLTAAGVRLQLNF